MFSRIKKNNRPQMSDIEIDYVVNLAKIYGHIVEFGSGRSTVIWEKHFTKVTSLENRLEWYRKIDAMLNSGKTDYLFCAPESMAFDNYGNELWNSRNPTDYGTLDEFKAYFNLAKKIIDDAQEDTVFFVDGNLRSEISNYILNSRKNPTVLLHDVIPEREYLNDWRFETSKNLNLVQIDSLTVITNK
jgi:hypothetical protein